MLSAEYTLEDLKNKEEKYIQKYTQQERELLALKKEINNLKTKLQQQEFFELNHSQNLQNTSLLNNVGLELEESVGPNSHREQNNVRVLDDTSDHGDKANNDSDTEITTIDNKEEDIKSFEGSNSSGVAKYINSQNAQNKAMFPKKISTAGL